MSDVEGNKMKGRPGRKRLGDEVFVPVTMKVEPSELATIESKVKYSGHFRSDVMRGMLTYGLAHVKKDAFVRDENRLIYLIEETSDGDICDKSCDTYNGLVYLGLVKQLGFGWIPLPAALETGPGMSPADTEERFS